MIGDNIKRCMELKDMSVNELAEKADVPVETIRSLIYGKSDNPKINTLIALKRALDVSLCELLGEITEGEQAVLDNYRKCSKHGKQIVQLMAEKHALAAVSEKAGVKREIPCYIPVSHLDDGIEDSTSNIIYIETVNEDAFAAYKIMTNNFINYGFYDGDVILVAKKTLQFGDKAVFSTGRRAYFRIFEKSDKPGYRFKLRAMNIQGEDFYVNEFGNGFMFIGVIVDVISG